jgi:dienelactone hydrolase
LINVQLIADQLAANGYFVLMPDLFYGDAVSLDQKGALDIPKWFNGDYHEKNIAHTLPVIDVIVEKVVAEMRSKYNVKIGIQQLRLMGRRKDLILERKSARLDTASEPNTSFAT